MIGMNVTVSRAPMPQTHLIFRTCLLVFVSVSAKQAVHEVLGLCASLHRNTGVTDVCFYVLFKKILSVQTQALS